MDCFICTVKTGDLLLKEHEYVKWLSSDSLYSVDWLPADQKLISEVDEYLNKS